MHLNLHLSPYTPLPLISSLHRHINIYYLSLKIYRMSLPVPLDYRATSLLVILSINPITLPSLQALLTNGTRITSLLYEVGGRIRVFSPIDFEHHGWTVYSPNGVLAEQPIQGTTEEINDAPERFGANINMELGSKENHLSEPRKDSAICAKVSRPDGLLI